MNIISPNQNWLNSKAGLHVLHCPLEVPGWVEVNQLIHWKPACMIPSDHVGNVLVEVSELVDP